MTTHDNERLAWMLNEVMAQPEVHHALLVSADGFVRAQSESLHKDIADRVAAALSGVQATSSATAEFCKSERSTWQQSLTQFEDGFVITIRAADGTFLSVGTSRSADVAVIASKMQQVVNQLGQAMTTAPRLETGSHT